jgi:4'-phosphopantetheinyl transferase
MERGLSLPAGEIQIWVCRDEAIDDPQLLRYYESVLGAAERERLAQFHFARHRHQYLVTRALVRHVLSLYRPDIGPGLWRFGSNAHGKPEIAPGLEPALRFNVSHTDGLVVMAISRQEVGIDVENTRREGEWLPVAQRFFAPVEWQDVQQRDLAQRQRRFFELWTLKEAYVKARGTGLSLAFDSFAFRLGRPCAETLEFSAMDDCQGHWRFWSGRLLDQFCLALAAPGRVQGPGLSLSVGEIVPGVEIRDIHCVCHWHDRFASPLRGVALPAIARPSLTLRAAPTYQCL